MTAADRAKTTLRIQAALASAIALFGHAGAARAHGDPAELSVVDRETGQVLRAWRHDGRLFVVGRPGDRYSLRVTNDTDGEVMVVMSVDGVNIVTGETAAWDQIGYVLSAHQSYDVTGWRKSDTEVAAFTFAPLPQSYAARTGRPADVGVIGMAVFREKYVAPPPPPEPVAPPRPWDEGYNTSRASPPLPAPPPAAKANASTTVAEDIVGTAERRSETPPTNVPAAVSAFTSPRRDQANADRTSGASQVEAAAEPRDEKLGTGHGAREWSLVHNVDFVRATPWPQFTRQIEYDTYANLVAGGVIDPDEGAKPHPRPFPSNPDGAGYVPDPPG